MLQRLPKALANKVAKKYTTITLENILNGFSNNSAFFITPSPTCANLYTFCRPPLPPA